MHVRQALSQDLKKVAELFNQYRCFYGRRSDLELATRFLRERMSKDQSVILVAESQPGKLVAFTQLYPSFSSVAAAPAYVLNDLYVAPEHRRQGAGRALLEAAREYAQRLGAVALSLSTGVDNKNAQALYESLGWVRDQQYLHYNLALEVDIKLQPPA